MDTNILIIHIDQDLITGDFKPMGLLQNEGVWKRQHLITDW